jgi:hypothetical protein
MAPVFYAAVSVVAVVFAVSGVVTFLIGLRRLRTVALARFWPQARGTVVTARVVEREDEGVTLFAPEITYTFEVGGKSFTATRVGPEEVETSARQVAQAVVDRYSAGATVSVFHAPNEPLVCLLEPGISMASLIIPLTGVVLSGLGAAMWALVRRLSGI